MSYIIGLTGQSGSGKSVVASILKEKGFKIIDCDLIAHQNMEPKGVAYNEIVAEFGDKILSPDSAINRRLLGSIVFNDKKALEALNSITHKYITEEVNNQLKNADNAVIDAPLLFEAGLDKLCSSIWAVVCPEEIRAERVMARDNISYSDAMARFKNQKSMEFFKNNCHIVFENTNSIERLKEEVINEINKISF